MADAIADFASLEEPVDQTVDTSADGSAQDGANDIQVADPASTDGSAPTEPTDGRKGPQALRDTVKSLSEQSPEHAGQLKEMANSYFREKAYKQAFETPQLAADAKSLIDTVGGIEGISKLQERDQQFTQQDEMYRDGNPDILQNFAKDFPEGFSALAPHYLSLLSQKNPEAFNNAVVPYAVGLLDNAGFSDFLGNLQRETDPARSKQMVENLIRWYQGAQNGAKELKTAPKNGTTKPDDGKASLQTEREAIFSEGVAMKVNAAVEAPLAKATDQYAKQNGWNDDQKAYFKQQLSDAVVKQMNGDKNYTAQVDLRKKNTNRSHDTVASYISGEFNRRLTDIAFETSEKVKKLLGTSKGKPATTGVTKPGGPQTAAGGRPLLISQQPNDADIDWSKDPNQLLFITNQSYLKNGKFVTWPQK